MKQKIFIDTNVFLNLLLNKEKKKVIYNFLDKGNYAYYTNSIVLNELRFRLLFQQASEYLNSNKKYEILKFIKKDLSFRKRVISDYIDFYINLSSFTNILEVTTFDELSTSSITINEGLLPSDASILNSMRKEDIKIICTDDKDFKKIKGLEVIEI